MKNKENHSEEEIYNIIQPILEDSQAPDWSKISKEIDEEFIDLYNLTGIF